MLELETRLASNSRDLPVCLPGVEIKEVCLPAQICMSSYIKGLGVFKTFKASAIEDRDLADHQLVKYFLRFRNDALEDKKCLFHPELNNYIQNV